jgi:GTP cyclohydrolase I
MSASSGSSPDARQVALADAVRELLLACGLDLDHEDLVGTPRRVARLWTELVVSGYDVDPAKLLGDPMLADGDTELVVVQDIPCHGMCPHHLMPWVGQATVAYLPQDKIVGFGRLAELIHCFARRLTLQEQVCNDVVDALMTHLDALGAACVITGQHNCLNVPDDKHGTRVVTASYRGELKTRPDLQAQLTSGG